VSVDTSGRQRTGSGCMAAHGRHVRTYETWSSARACSVVARELQYCSSDPMHGLLHHHARRARHAAMHPMVCRAPTSCSRRLQKHCPQVCASSDDEYVVVVPSEQREEIKRVRRTYVQQPVSRLSWHLNRHVVRRPLPLPGLRVAPYVRPS
jgi:cytosine/adenosine deaminase-related metal-dependent hydrolase